MSEKIGDTYKRVSEFLFVYFLSSLQHEITFIHLPVYHARIHRHALWILGEYCSTAHDILNVMKEMKDGLGEVRVMSWLWVFPF